MKHMIVIAAVCLATPVFAEPLKITCGNKEGVTYLTQEDDLSVRKLSDWREMPGTKSLIVSDNGDVDISLDSRFGMVNLEDAGVYSLKNVYTKPTRLLHYDEKDGSFSFVVELEDGSGLTTYSISGLQTESPILMSTTINNQSQYPTASLFIAECRVQ